VRFAGHVPHEDLPAYYALGDVFVLSSTYEGIPKVPVEAAAVGVPTVCRDTPRHDDIVIDGETGYVSRADDEADFAAKVTRLLQNPALAAQMGANARAHALRTFDRDASIDALVEAWRFAANLRR
jgi:glycosyltransferase involved in cell wall biosynthesis